ncbi:zinc finger protein 341 [Patella vulgata]|uniref:zinc finger protein 341 n=1 Tax=Patella vulgata TaxID=6465 RepID=UPI00217FE83C|nr:zinc finger protein 341 [Patella vulgata]
MSQTLFEALTGAGGDNQTAVAVQSLLDSQSVPETQDEEDLFQCGKCKKQFNSLPLFVGHKQSECSVIVPVMSQLRPVQSVVQPITPSTSYTTVNSAQAMNQPLSAYSTIPTSPLPQISTQNLVLSDDLMTFTNLDNSLQNSTIQMVTTPFNNRTSNNVSILSPVNVTTTFASNGSTYTQCVPSNYTNTLPVHQQTQQITFTTIQQDNNKQQKHTTKAGRRTRTNVTRAMKEDDHMIQVGYKVKLDDGTPGVTPNKKKLKCQYCQKLFAKNFDLQQHIRAHTGVKPFQCIVCGRAFAQKSNVKKHMATHKVWPTSLASSLPEQPLAELVTDEQEEEEHQHQHQMLPDPDQSIPTSQSPDEKGGNSKIKVVIDNSYVCHYCPAKFKTYFQLKTHMVEHKVEQVYKCVMKNCGSTFQELDAFLEHTKTHEEEMSYRCHLCNKYFPSLYELGVHQYTHSLYPNQGPKPGPRHFQCNKCLNKYSTPEALDAHLASTSHQYQCPHCEKYFTCERYLRRHLPTHGTEGQFQCTVCWKKFKTEHYLKMHLLIHTGEKPFSCNICSHSFNRKDKLKRHMLIHDTVKKYRCPFKSLTGCTKEFNRPDKLKAHIISHSGIKPFKCTMCGKGFSRKPHLVEHERGHKADYKYRCEKCGKGFFRPKLFSEHKCVEPKIGGAESNIFRPRSRRKIGRPRKRNSEPAVKTESREPVNKPYGTRSTTRPKKPTNIGVTLEETGQVPPLVSQGEMNNVTSSAMKQHMDSYSGTVANVAVTPSANMMNSSTVVLETRKTQSMLEHEYGQGELIDHYVVHLAEASDGSAPTIQTTFIPAVSGTQVLTENGAIPVTIIEAQPVQMSDQGFAVSRDDSMVTAQVLVASSRDGQQTLVTCPAQLVDYSTNDNDPVLQGTENMLKASAEILSSSGPHELLHHQTSHEELLHNQASHSELLHNQASHAELLRNSNTDCL